MGWNEGVLGMRSAVLLVVLGAVAVSRARNIPNWGYRRDLLLNRLNQQYVQRGMLGAYGYGAKGASMYGPRYIHGYGANYLDRYSGRDRRSPGFLDEVFEVEPEAPPEWALFSPEDLYRGETLHGGATYEEELLPADFSMSGAHFSDVQNGLDYDKDEKPHQHQEDSDEEPSHHNRDSDDEPHYHNEKFSDTKNHRNHDYSDNESQAQKYYSDEKPNHGFRKHNSHNEDYSEESANAYEQIDYSEESANAYEQPDYSEESAYAYEHAEYADAYEQPDSPDRFDDEIEAKIQSIRMHIQKIDLAKKSVSPKFHIGAPVLPGFALPHAEDHDNHDAFAEESSRHSTGPGQQIKAPVLPGFALPHNGENYVEHYEHNVNLDSEHGFQHNLFEQNLEAHLKHQLSQQTSVHHEEDLEALLERQLHRPDLAQRVENLDAQMQHLVHHQEPVHHDQSPKDEDLQLYNQKSVLHDEDLEALLKHQLYRPDPAHHDENLDAQKQHLVHHQELVHHDESSEDEGFPLPLYRRPKPEHSFGHKTNPHQMEDKSYYDPRDYNPEPVVYDVENEQLEKDYHQAHQADLEAQFLYGISEPNIEYGHELHPQPQDFFQSHLPGGSMDLQGEDANEEEYEDEALDTQHLKGLLGLLAKRYDAVQPSNLHNEPVHSPFPPRNGAVGPHHMNNPIPPRNGPVVPAQMNHEPVEPSYPAYPAAQLKNDLHLFPNMHRTDSRLQNSRILSGSDNSRHSDEKEPHQLKWNTRPNVSNDGYDSKREEEDIAEQFDGYGSGPVHQDHEDHRDLPLNQNKINSFIPTRPLNRPFNGQPHHNEQIEVKDPIGVEERPIHPRFRRPAKPNHQTRNYGNNKPLNRPSNNPRDPPRRLLRKPSGPRPLDWKPSVPRKFNRDNSPGNRDNGPDNGYDGPVNSNYGPDNHHNGPGNRNNFGALGDFGNLGDLSLGLGHLGTDLSRGLEDFGDDLSHGLGKLGGLGDLLGGQGWDNQGDQHDLWDNQGDQHDQWEQHEEPFEFNLDLPNSFF